MAIDHSLKNTNRRAIQSTVYNHHFVVLDKQPHGTELDVESSVPHSGEDATQ
jgi:hypothetical protein